ncbi:hypothetical protein Micbo1qcDRAFT_65117 [Microdochium bolleyi]|uniref:Uncharacterized protein n=1 Tax=Microdochium bolleyi TaxID=196109 RepID=A0A136J2L0_9PEZI|nr:hypothetical protein Micbo1qcDRAFT_65117 [Microdochium bolleyi]
MSENKTLHFFTSLPYITSPPVLSHSYLFFLFFQVLPRSVLVMLFPSSRRKHKWTLLFFSPSKERHTQGRGGTDTAQAVDPYAGSVLPGGVAAGLETRREPKAWRRSYLSTCYIGLQTAIGYTGLVIVTSTG